MCAWVETIKQLFNKARYEMLENGNSRKMVNLPEGCELDWIWNDMYHLVHEIYEVGLAWKADRKWHKERTRDFV